MNDLDRPRPSSPASSVPIERALAASCLLLHASLLFVIDLTVAFGAMGSGTIGLIVMIQEGVNNSLVLFGVSLFVGLIAASLLLVTAIEGLIAILALRGRPQGLVPVSLLSLIVSLLLLPMGVVTCSIPGIVVPVGMLFASFLALSFAGQSESPLEPKPQ